MLKKKIAIRRLKSNDGDVNITMPGWVPTSQDRLVRVVFVAEYDRNDTCEAIEQAEQEISGYGRLVDTFRFYPGGGK